MDDIMNSLSKVSARLSEESFLTNRGLSNEVGIHVFCYDPKDELTVRAYFESLKSKADVPYRLVERDLYKIFLELCEDKHIMNSISNMEERKGKEYVRTTGHPAAEHGDEKGLGMVADKFRSQKPEVVDREARHEIFAKHVARRAKLGMAQRAEPGGQ